MRKEDKSTIIEQIAATVKEYSHFYLIDITAMNAAFSPGIPSLALSLINLAGKLAVLQNIIAVVPFKQP